MFCCGCLAKLLKFWVLVIIFATLEYSHLPHVDNALKIPSRKTEYSKYLITCLHLSCLFPTLCPLLLYHRHTNLHCIPPFDMPHHFLMDHLILSSRNSLHLQSFFKSMHLIVAHFFNISFLVSFNLTILFLMPGKMTYNEIFNLLSISFPKSACLLSGP